MGILLRLMKQRFSILRKNIPEEKLHVARKLRQEMTPAETCLWAELRGNQLGGLHFRRQQIIGGLIVDFYCHDARLVIELDGEVHESTQEYDAERDNILSELGLSVLHFRNEEALDHLADVLKTIRKAVRP